MKKMKKLIACFLALSLVLVMAACGSSANDTAETKPAETEEATEEAVAEEEAAPAEEEEASAEAEEEAPAAAVDEGSNESASGSTDKDVYVDMWGAFPDDNANAEWVKERMAEYEKIYEEETGISLCMEYVAQDNWYNGVAEKLTAGAASKLLPVMATLEDSYTGAFYPICTDLAPYLGQEVIDNYTDGLLVSCYYDDTLYAVPFGKSCIIFYANQDLVEQVGWKLEDIDTWDDMHQCALAISQLGDDYEGYVFYWDTDAWGFESALYSNGGNFDNEDGTKITFADDGVGAIYIQLLKDMLADGSAWNTYDYSIEDQWGTAFGKFMDQKLGFYMCSSSMNGAIRNAFEEGTYERFNAQPIPQPAGLGGHSMVTGGSNLMVSNTATEAQKQAAAGFIKYIASDENAVSFTKVSGYFVNTKSALESEYMDELIERDPTVVPLMSIMQYAHKRPTTPYFREMHSYLTEQFIKFSNEAADSDPEALVNEWAAYCQQILDEANG